MYVLPLEVERTGRTEAGVKVHRGHVKGTVVGPTRKWLRWTMWIQIDPGKPAHCVHAQTRRELQGMARKLLASVAQNREWQGCEIPAACLHGPK